MSNTKAIGVAFADPQLESITLDLNSSASLTVGQIAWNETDQTLNIGMDYGVVQQVGEETYARVGNTTGATMMYCIDPMSDVLYMYHI